MTASTTSFGGRYQVIERIGTGGMAEVYRGRDELLGREVAIKVLSERFSRDKSFIERFRREAQAAANLNHPNIVSLYDYGSDHGTYFIVMEFIEGRTLGDLIRDEGPLMPERAAEIAADVAKGLERAHTSGLVHRDIKPGNIMITNTGETKVTDFGIARALGSESEATMTQAGMVIGTASYLSPEQAQGNPVDARSDVYSLGCVLFEMLTGGPVFAGDTPLSIAYKHVREQPQPPSARNREVPRSLDAITMKALAKNPDNRYSSASDMNDDLQRFLSGQRVLATPLMATETMVQRPVGGTAVMTTADDEDEGARRGLWYALLTLLILALLGIGGYFLINNMLGEETTEVPEVLGMRERAARQTLEDAGFEVGVERQASERPKGKVFEQDPAAGEGLEEGELVTITVSSGPATVDVPDLIGLTENQAGNRLEDEGLRLGEVTQEPSDEIEEGRVTSQSVPEGTPVETGSVVAIALSSGPEPAIVPGVIGFTEEAAIAAIEGAGLVPVVDRSPSEEQPEGIVFAQDPDEGFVTSPGEEVVIAVSEGSAAEPMPTVTGLPAEDAQATLENDYGLVVTVLEEDPEQGCLEPPGNVCRQDPEPGTEVNEGDNVTIYVQPEGGPPEEEEEGD